MDDEIHAFAGDYFNVLMEGSALIDQAVMTVKMKTMTPEERAKQEMIQKNKEEYKAKMRAEAEYKKQLEELSMKDRKVKQDEKNKDSKGNNLKFGANLVKFEPPPEQRKGWWAARIVKSHYSDAISVSGWNYFLSRSVDIFCIGQSPTLFQFSPTLHSHMKIKLI